MKLEYTTDICGNEILQDETGQHQVMMAWEKPYMEESIKILDPFGKVLEIGFGMGYSASEIDADSGDILYIENRAPITRAADQTENIKLVIEF